MADKTKIEWADHTWSPWIGCQKVGPGCDHCYAEALNKRGGGGNWGPDAPRRRTSKDYWRKPYRWNTRSPGSVFPSMCDPFDNAVDEAWRRDFGWVIRETPNLTWLLLTKRIGNASEMLRQMFGGACPSNIMVGATFVNQPEVDRDWDKLMHVAHRWKVRTFGSFEPLLGGIELPPFGSPYLGWAIAGGESGPKARPMHPDWARSLRDQCHDAGVSFFHKQNGEFAPGEIAGEYLSPEKAAKGMSYFDGRWDECWSEPDGHCDDEPDVYRVGKKRAGRMLDGREWSEFPA